MHPMTIEYARAEDVGDILRFIRALAAYEHLEHEVVADEATLHHWLFEEKKAEVIFCVAQGRRVGFALFFHNFSTFLGRAGLYLEDLYVLPEERGKGYGRFLLTTLAKIAVERGCGRLEWSCLDWNASSIAFYRSMGAVPMDGWSTYRLTGDTLLAAAKTE